MKNNGKFMTNILYNYPALNVFWFGGFVVDLWDGLFKLYTSIFVVHTLFDLIYWFFQFCFIDSRTRKQVSEFCIDSETSSTYIILLTKRYDFQGFVHFKKFIGSFISVYWYLKVVFIEICENTSDSVDSKTSNDF
jgi:hypothetical protein